MKGVEFYKLYNLYMCTYVQLNKDDVNRDVFISLISDHFIII